MKRIISLIYIDGLIIIKFNILQYEEILRNDELYLNIKIFIIIIV
jgi:hypothetical protein